MLLKLIMFVKCLFRDVRDKSKKYPYGVWLYVGLPGRGKTLSIVEYLDRVRAQYKDEILIVTNFHYRDQDQELKGWRDLIKEYDRPVVFALDEVQLTFGSREWSDFPREMVTMLTQNRKMRKQLVCSTQSFERVDKVFRELTQYVIECRCVMGRWVFQRAFETSDYMQGVDPKVGKVRHRSWRYSFIATDEIREKYNTMLRLDDLKKTQFSEVQRVVQVI